MGTKNAPAILSQPRMHGMRPARVARIPGRQYQTEPGCQRSEDNPPGFAQQSCQALLQG